MSYICPKSKKEIKELDPEYTRCPTSGWRVLYKSRPPIAKELGTD